MTTPSVWPSGDLVEAFPITLPNGVVWRGFLYKSKHRAVGRRIMVRDEAGVRVFDTDDCYDLGNARSALDGWLAGKAKEITAATELALVEEAERQMEPHHEDEHADSGEGHL